MANASETKQPVPVLAGDVGASAPLLFWNDEGRAPANLQEMSDDWRRGEACCFLQAPSAAERVLVNQF